MPAPFRRYSRGRAGFTLIEMLAVVAILALLATFVAPSLDAVRQRRLRAEAMSLAAQLEFARQRTVMTGVPHRVLLDLEAGSYVLFCNVPGHYGAGMFTSFEVTGQ